MQKVSIRFFQMLLLVAITALTGCVTTQQEYQGAFNNQNALTNNQKAFVLPSEPVFKIVKQTFIQQGFTVENADTKSGIIKAVRNLQDIDEPEISYNIHASADISDLGQSDTNVSLSASQQTILHRASTTWWHLLWIIPVIPTGTEYQTLVIKEGNITDPVFYTDFFKTLTVSVAKYENAVKVAAAKAAAKAEAERIAAEKIAAEKAAIAAKIAAEKAAIEKIAAEKAAVAKAQADKVAAEKAVAEKEAAKKEADRVAEEFKKTEEDAAKAALAAKKRKKVAKK